MKRICICSSIRFKDHIKSAIEEFNKIGIEAVFNNLDKNPIEPQKTKYQLAIDHYKAIDQSDAIYFIVPEGYMGTSCKIELGYCYAKNKPIYFSEKTNDPSLDWYATDLIAINDLSKFLSHKI